MKDCLEWQGFVSKQGYGQCQYLGKSWKAHRLFFALFKGNLDPNLTIDHLCRNRKCVNPDHLEQVTLKENVLRGTAPSARYAVATSCVRGHKFSVTNTYKYKGMRQCKKCHLIKDRKLYKLNPDKKTQYKNVYSRGLIGYYSSFTFKRKYKKSPLFKRASQAYEWLKIQKKKAGIE